MYANELEQCIKKIPMIAHHMKGIFPIDQLPDELRLYEFIIVNTE